MGLVSVGRFSYFLSHFFIFFEFFNIVTISSVVKHGLQSFENSLRLLHTLLLPGKIAAAVASFTGYSKT
jgi:hypothetical protein